MEQLLSGLPAVSCPGCRTNYSSLPQAAIERSADTRTAMPAKEAGLDMLEALERRDPKDVVNGLERFARDPGLMRSLDDGRLQWLFRAWADTIEKSIHFEQATGATTTTASGSNLPGVAPSNAIARPPANPVVSGHRDIAVMPSEEPNLDPPFTSPDLTTRLAPPHKKQRRGERDVSDAGCDSHNPPIDKVLKGGKDVTGWSGKRILEAVRDEIGKDLTPAQRLELSFRMDGHARNCAAVVVNFDGPNGVIIVEDGWFVTGEKKSRDGKWLYITSNAIVPREYKPDVAYIYRS